MKKNLLIICALACSLSIQAASLDRVGSPRTHRMQKAEPTSSLVWLPGTIKSFRFESSNQSWMEENTTTVTYNENGLPTVETDTFEKVTYEYNADGNPTCVTHYFFDGNGYNPHYRYRYTYDTVVPDFKTQEVMESYNNSSWMVQSQTNVVITRNAQGNVTKVVTSNGAGPDREEMEITYGTDGRASDIKVFYLEGGEPELEGWFSDIVWENTNGQILPDDGSLSDEDLMVGANRIKSLTINNLEGSNEKAYLTATYTGTPGDYDYELKWRGKIISSCTRRILDGYGSFEETSFEIDLDYDDVTGILYEDGSCNEFCTKVYDSYGLELLDKYEDKYDDGNSEISEKVGTVAYDTTYGYPLEYTVKSRYADNALPGEFTNDSRKLFSNYAQYGSVISVETGENSEAPVEYYNLQGIRVSADALVPGIYIRRQGNSTSKIIRR